eukprot:TRINITY_DN12859_c0_g1_i2.p1 TRINITY_DN12859_c0_g1~~TRINITY_DN12859_c0_g1_i2.p1  ORF type:complete len:591 (-),score=65.84 TRINITY_DN12859_c0_g1_i2:69-1841(-)
MDPLLQPQYYRIPDPSASVLFRVRLQRISGASINEIHRDEKAIDSAAETVLELRWQEKVLCPRELIERRNALRGRQGLGADDGEPFQDGLSEIILYTYVEKDRFVRSAHNSVSEHQTTGHQPRATSETVSAIRLPRAAEPDGTCSAFFIVAAVDVDLAAARDGVLDMTEKVLCEVKAHDSGLLEVTPGFSTKQADVGEEGAFPSDHMLHKEDKAGPRLNSYSFTSRRGNMFEYTIENIAEGASSSKHTEEWTVQQNIADAKQVAGQRQGAGLNLSPASVLPSSSRVYLLLELMSAAGDLGGCCTTEFEVVLPLGWSSVESADSGTWHQFEDGRCALSGSTHAAYSTIVWRSAAATESVHAPHLPMKGCAALLAVLLAVALVVGSESVFLTALLLVLLCSVYAGIGPQDSSSLECVHFGHPVEMELIHHEELNSIGSTPQLFVKLCSTHNFGRQTVAGYGHVFLPRTPGTHDVTVRTWCPQPTLSAQLWDYHLGGANSLRHAPGPASAQMRLHESSSGKYGFRTCAGSSMHVRVHVAEQVLLPPQSALHPSGNPVSDKTVPVFSAATASVPDLVRRMREQLERSKSRPQGL